VKYSLGRVPELLEGCQKMTAYETLLYHESKATTKQVPLFEEEDDGNLIPYHPEE
jgi:hypothetical protein